MPTDRGTVVYVDKRGQVPFRYVRLLTQVRVRADVAEEGDFVTPGQTPLPTLLAPSKWRIWRGWNVWTKTECEHCGGTHKVTSGKPRDRVRQWILVRLGR